MPVKTKSIYERAGPEDGVRVLITRYYPRGVKKDRFNRWVKALSPSRELLSSYMSGEKTWGEFSESFLAELRSSQEGREALLEVAALGRAGDVTLLCYEREGLPCHRHLVADVLANPGSLEARGGRKRKGATGRSSKTEPVSAVRARNIVLARGIRRIRFYSRRKVGRKAPK